MRQIQLIFILLLLTSCATQKPMHKTPLILQKSVLETAPFISHTGDGDFKNYLALNVNYPPIALLKSQVENHLASTLINRNEAHITVISPVEFDRILKNKISMKDIEQIALNNRLQAASWRPLCVGKGSQVINEKEESTFYLVVESADLLAIRREVQKLYVSQGGNTQDFNPQLFFPHITIGFTLKDLHYEDGVVKNLNSCWRQIEMRDPAQEEVIVD